MSSNKHIYDGGNPYQRINPNSIIEIGKVVNIEDPNDMGRIQVVVKGPASLGGDDNTLNKNLVYAFPMIPKFFGSTPKVGEAVLLMSFNLNEKQVDRLYIGPIISQPDKIGFDPYDYSAISPFSFKFKEPGPTTAGIPDLIGLFPKKDDIIIQGRYNTDIIQKPNEIQIRAGKFVKTTPNTTNPFNFTYNSKNMGYIQMKNDAIIKKGDDKNKEERGTITNIVANKINLLTHKDGSPSFNLTTPDKLITDDEMEKILNEAHPLPFGDVTGEILDLMFDAILGHVHNGNGNTATDLTTSGNKLSVDNLRKKYQDLKKAMNSKNVKIN